MENITNCEACGIFNLVLRLCNRIAIVLNPLPLDNPDGDIVLNIRGIGALELNVPGALNPLGGNCRGSSAVDLQKFRFDNTQVASGDQSFIGAGINNIASGLRSAIVGGNENTASASQSAIAGGTSNEASEENSFIGGGVENTASGNLSAVIGGTENTASTLQSIVAGGTLNGANGENSIIGGGTINSTSGNLSAVIGGSENISSLSQSVITAGSLNVINTNGESSFIGGGTKNNAAASQTAIIGGTENITTMSQSVIAGGSSNAINIENSFIGGGSKNIASDNPSTIVGGVENITSASQSGIAGGSSNIGNGQNSFIGGGSMNTASGNLSTVVGGTENTTLASAIQSAIIGGTLAVIGNTSMGATNEGQNSFIGGGRGNTTNTTTDTKATVVGGESNSANSEVSFIGGGINNVITTTIASFIGSSNSNNINIPFSSIVGGQRNVIQAVADSVSAFNTIIGGFSNIIEGNPNGFNAIIGGDNNSINSNFIVYNAIVGASFCITLPIPIPFNIQVNSIAIGGTIKFISSSNSAMAGGFQCYVLGNNSATIGGNFMGTNQINSVAVGHSNQPGAFMNGPARLFMVGNGILNARSNAFSVTADGNAHVQGMLTTGGADYAEYFESDDQEAIPIGTSVVLLKNGKIRTAKEGDIPIGIISSNPAVLSNTYEEYWHDKYQRDSNHRIIYEEITVEEEVQVTNKKEVENIKYIEEIINGKLSYRQIEEKNIVNEPEYDEIEIYKDDKVIGKTKKPRTKKQQVKKIIPKISDKFDPTKKYIPRSSRKEWNIVALLGLVYILPGQITRPNWILFNNGTRCLLTKAK